MNKGCTHKFLKDPINKGIMHRKMTQCVLPWLDGGCNFSAFTGGISWFCHITWISSIKITRFPAHLELCKDTPRKQTLYYLQSKDSSGGCSVNASGQDSSYLIRGSILSCDFPTRSGKPPALWEVKLLSHANSVIPMGYSLPSSSIHGIFQARVLEWVTISFSRGYSWPRDQTRASYIADRNFTLWAIIKAPQTWVTISFSRGSSSPGDQTQMSLMASRCFTPWATRKPKKKKKKKKGNS